MRDTVLILKKDRKGVGEKEYKQKDMYLRIR